MSADQFEQKEEPKPSPLRLWTLTEVAAATNLSVRTLQRMIKNEKLKTSPACQGVRIPNEEVLRLTNRD